MKQCHLPPDQRPGGHIPELYIDAEALVDSGTATLEEMDLILLGFGIIVDAVKSDHGGCVPCGLEIFERIGARPGIVETTMRVLTVASAQLQIDCMVMISSEYDPMNSQHRKDAFSGLAAHWVNVVTKMQTCGIGCPTCAHLGAAWPSQIGRHGR